MWKVSEVMDIEAMVKPMIVSFVDRAVVVFIRRGSSLLLSISLHFDVLLWASLTGQPVTEMISIVPY